MASDERLPQGGYAPKYEELFMSSEFLKDVMASAAVVAAYRVGNHAICTMKYGGRQMDFLAIDENDWHGVLMAQYQQPIAEEQSDAVQYFCRAIEPMPLPALFRLEFHDTMREVRAVIRWPLHEAYCPCDDAKTAMQILFDCWTTIEPFIQKALGGEDINMLIAEANRQLDALFPKRRQQTTA